MRRLWHLFVLILATMIVLPANVAQAHFTDPPHSVWMVDLYPSTGRRPATVRRARGPWGTTFQVTQRMSVGRPTSMGRCPG